MPLSTPRRLALILGGSLIYGVVFVCIWIYYLFYSGGDAAIIVWYLPSNGQTLINTQYYWQLLTPSLIHFTEWHLIGNLVMWWYLGRVINSASPVLLGCLLVSGAMVSNLAQWLVSTGLFGGLSGVVACLVGFLACYQWLRPEGRFFIQRSFVIIFVAYLMIVSTGRFGVYSNAAHFVGLFWGAVVALIYVKLVELGPFAKLASEKLKNHQS